MSKWFDQDDLWETLAPIMFHEARLATTPQDIDRVLGYINVEPGAPILDLCCGPGRHSLELARRGMRVTGVDRTTAYLDMARKQANAEGLSIEFVQSDMREFVRPASFQGAVNLYTSFGYFEDIADDRRVLDNLFASLVPGGTLVMELMGKEVLARIYRERFWDERDGLLLLQEPKVSKAWSWMDSRWILIKDGVQREFRLSHRIYSAAELSALLTDSGFRDLECYGDLEGASYDQNAKRLVLVARKPME